MTRPRIRFRTLALVIATLIAITLSAFQYASHLKASDEISKSFSNDVLSAVQNGIVAALRFPLAYGDSDAEISRVVDGLMQNEFVYGIVVKDNDGRVLKAKMDETKTEGSRKVFQKTIMIIDDRLPDLDPLSDNEDTKLVLGTVTLLLTSEKAEKSLSSVFTFTLYSSLAGIVAIVLMLIPYFARQEKHNKIVIGALDQIGRGQHVEIDNKTSIKEMHEIVSGVNALSKTLQESRDALEKSDAIKNNLIARASHDLRNPINTINGLIELLHETSNALEADDPKIQKMVEHIRIAHGATGSLVSILDQLLDFNLIKNGNFEYRESSFNPEVMFDNIYSANRKRGGNSVSFDVTCSTAVEANITNALVLSDPAKINRILNNLIENAFNNTKSGYIHVDWSIQKHDQGYVLAVGVEDTGCGILDENLSRIFDDYFRENTQTTGWGIGLTMVRQFLDVMGGSIEVSSVKNSGSTFRISVPVTLAPSTSNTMESAQIAGLTAIIVDDSESNCYTLKHILASYGIQSESYTSPLEALEAIKNRDGIQKAYFDVALVDYKMPDMNGVELAIKIDALLNTTAVVCVTAHVDTTAMSEIAKHSGAGNPIHACIQKPINREELVIVLSEISSGKKAHQTSLERLINSKDLDNQ